MKWLRVWTVSNLVIAALFLTVITLDGAPLDEWVFFVLMAALPWAFRYIWKRVTS